MTPLERLVGWASRLRLDDVPARVVRIAKTQVLSQLAAVRGGLSHPYSGKLVDLYGPPLQRDARSSASVLAALTAWLHFDDTAYAGHLSNSTANVPFAYAYADGLDGTALLGAVIAANECAARITAAATLGPFRGQMAAHTHLAGAVAGRLHCAGADARQWADAFGLAFAMPPWPLTHAFFRSDARMLSSTQPIRIGLDACDAAAAGLRGAPDIFEHPKGFLARFASVPLPEAITAGLGRRWHTDTLSFKVHPSGPGIDAAVDCALKLRARLGPVHPAGVTEVVIATSLYTLLVDKAVTPYLDGPRTPLAALVTASCYAVATALLTGKLEPADFAAPAVDCPSRWDLAGRIRFEHDPGMSAALLASDAPFGEAIRQAGDRAAGWLRELGGEDLVGLAGTPGPPRSSFRGAGKVTPARVSVRLADGSVHSEQVDIPAGAAGGQSAARQRHLVRDKYLATGGPADVLDAVDELERLDAGELRRMLDSALSVS